MDFTYRMFANVFVVLLLCFLSWAFQAIQPPPPRICGSPNGPPITSTRIKLSDGRYLAYKETGIYKEKSKFKIIVVHGFGGSRNFSLPVSPELVEELGLYFLSFDRAGYGESDPNPKRSVRSEAFDIQELADRLEVGLKFYVVGVSMGGYPTWACLKYIPYSLEHILSFLKHCWSQWVLKIVIVPSLRDSKKLYQTSRPIKPEPTTSTPSLSVIDITIPPRSP